METNRQDRWQAQQQLSKRYRLLARRATVQKLSSTDVMAIERARQEIAGLEKEHVRLNKQFIAKQIKFRQTINDQRHQLVETVNMTRARTAAMRTGVALVASINLNSSDESNESAEINEFALASLKQA